jgi:hypothetical protein
VFLGVLNSLYKLFGFKGAKKESRYELVQALADSQENGFGGENNTHEENSYDDDDDDGTLSTETVVVFRRVPNTAMALPIEAPSSLHRDRISSN